MDTMNKRTFLKAATALCLTPLFPALSTKHKPETRDERILRKLPIKVDPLKPFSCCLASGIDIYSSDEDIVNEIIEICKIWKIKVIKNIQINYFYDRNFLSIIISV